MGNLSRLLVALAVAIASIGIVSTTRISAEPGWEQGGLTEQVSALAIDSGDDRALFATGASGLWRTADGGANWSLVSPEKIATALVIDPKNPSILYASGNPTRGGGGIYKSADGGKNWSIVRSGESPSTIAIDPSNTNIVYAGMTMNGNHEILKSTDGGANWYPLLRRSGSQSPGIGYVSALVLAPSKPNVIYAGLGIYHGGLVNRSDLFPGGWLHDIGLPMTEAVWAKVDKGDMKGRDVLIQAFQRTVLTYDPANPPDWQVERANVGTDYLAR